MRDAAVLGPYEASPLFADGNSSRPLVEGTVARGHLNDGDAYHTGRDDKGLVLTMPIEINEALLARGRERFNAYCAMCHGQDGYGQGMIVKRGFPVPPSLHIDRLRQMPDGHFFEVISRGFGRMPAYNAMVAVPDRWAVTAYIRALQLSQNATINDVPPDARRQLTAIHDATPITKEAGHE